jgi:hypothetical protein
MPPLSEGPSRLLQELGRPVADRHASSTACHIRSTFPGSGQVRASLLGIRTATTSKEQENA